MALKLVIGNKNYSSWSMRPWLALRASNIAFDEVFIPLYTGDADKQRIFEFHAFGQGTGADRWRRHDLGFPGHHRISSPNGFPTRGCGLRIAPGGPTHVRFRRRCIRAFAALRNECGMNLHRPVRAIALSADARADIARVQQIWIECRERYGKSGAVPVRILWRRRRHVCAGGASLSHLCDRGDARGAAYMDTMMSLPAFQEWTSAGLAETLVIEKFETT